METLRSPHSWAVYLLRNSLSESKKFYFNIYNVDFIDKWMYYKANGSSSI